MADTNHYQTGFVRALVEYIDFSSEGGTVNLDVWRPEAMMSKDEAVTKRAEMYAE